MNSSLLTFLIIVLNFSTSDGVDNINKECSFPTSCGKVHNIGYPFWGVGGRPQECGIRNPVFNLTCPSNGINDYPILRINDQYDHQAHPPSYRVLSINSSSNTIKLLTQFPQHTNCSIPLHEPAFSGTPFRYSSSVEMINLLQCNQIIGYDENNSISCPNDVTYTTLRYYYMQNLSNVSQNYKYFCTNFSAPVLRDGLEDLKRNRTTLKSVLSKGFEVGYPKENFLACHLCEDSGGTCGSSDKAPFVCFCKNNYRPYHYTCSKSEKLRHILEIGGFIVLISLIVCFLCCTKHTFRSQTWASRILSYHRLRSDLEMGNAFFGIPLFSYSELQEATKNFDPDRVLGDGAFGVVYHGILLDEREVAVKRLYEKNYKRVGQFMNEVEILTKLSHPNLVTLYGCTSRHSRELLLVYEFIPNGTVADHLYGKRSQSKSLTWTIRRKIAVQTAEALSYLHSSDIIHRDVKTNNILLDSDFSVKVADFGLSRLFPSDVSHLSTTPQGTPGYLDPEYHKCYQVTNKSDVYSFGVVLIELISSLPAIDMNRNGEEINLSTYAMNKIQHGKLGELVDKNLGYESNFKVKRMVNLMAELAFQCLQQEKEIRPSIEEVLEALKKIENLDYEELGAEEMSRGSGTSKSASDVAENEAEQPLRDALSSSSSSNSVIVGWNSRSTVSNQ